MSEPREFRNLALIGFMGVGKSSAGRLVANMLGFDFLDTDELIESRAGTSIAEIFKKHGEAAFRDLERRLVHELEGASNTVISTGGGLTAAPENLESLKRHALTVCLWANAETIWRRVRSQTHRPLLDQPDPEQYIRDLLVVREPAYRNADVLLNTELRPLKEVAAHIVHYFQEARRQQQPALKPGS